MVQSFKTLYLGCFKNGMKVIEKVTNTVFDIAGVDRITIGINVIKVR